MLITWAIRCGAFKAFTTLEGLFQSKYTTIEWAPEMLNTTVFQNAAGNSPLTTTSFDSFLSLIAQKAGYAESFSAYVFRQSAADAISKKDGDVKAKQVLYHSPKSNMLHMHYTRPIGVNIMGAMLGYDASAQQHHDDVIASRAPLVQIPIPVLRSKLTRQRLQETDTTIIKWKEDVAKLKKKLNPLGIQRWHYLAKETPDLLKQYQKLSWFIRVCTLKLERYEISKQTAAAELEQ
ncbi:hypothetical protein BC938DRAFT_476449 [Jimgerdemannia flammicorona]|uniref:Uncharacterized protein n=1 Tax=Jimgerdemannia flammicorona TaxID=994334 RepID=A0A433PH74_9FUNG|nr:hypothetical protein BC938DRAFT_476449 [Jimgerdemannia flammicorona]